MARLGGGGWASQWSDTRERYGSARHSPCSTPSIARAESQWKLEADSISCMCCREDHDTRTREKLRELGVKGFLHAGCARSNEVGAEPTLRLSRALRDETCDKAQQKPNFTQACPDQNRSRIQNHRQEASGAQTAECVPYLDGTMRLPRPSGLLIVPSHFRIYGDQACSSQAGRIARLACEKGRAATQAGGCCRVICPRLG